jgi:hypothetical protein
MIVLVGIAIVAIVVAGGAMAAGFALTANTRDERHRQERREAPATLEGGGSHLSREG